MKECRPSKATRTPAPTDTVSKALRCSIFHADTFITSHRRKMDVTMNISAKAKLLLCIALLLLCSAGGADAQDIYKCVNNGQVAYTDHPCKVGKGELLHQADDSEVINQYLDLGQDAAAKQYADARNLDSLYKQLFEARKEQMQAKAQQDADQAAADKQQEAADHQQALIEAAANRGRLQGENDALRQQNAQYQSQLAQPTYDNSAPYYDGGLRLSRGLSGRRSWP